jgi:hypothetical protein
MADIKDILGVSRDAAPGPKHEKPKAVKQVKPKGMSRCGKLALGSLEACIICMHP